MLHVVLHAELDVAHAVAGTTVTALTAHLGGPRRMLQCVMPKCMHICV
jgi:hypothetical protein